MKERWIRVDFNNRAKNKDCATGIQNYISFATAGSSFEQHTCPVCDSETGCIGLEIHGLEKTLTVLRCDCGSFFYPKAIAPNYEDIEGEDSFYMRLDQAEGIDAIIRPLLISSEILELPIVDVGCGLGFSADYMRWSGKSVTAFDPSTAARLSKKLLGIDIAFKFAYSDTLSPDAANLVFASEVIEHVPNPLLFMQNIRNLAGVNGYAIITTPNAEFLDESRSQAVMAAMLVPSQHLLLLSPKSLQYLGRKVGFLWIKTWSDNERLFMVAGPKEVTLDNSFSRESYQKYLRERTYHSEWIDRSLRFRGFGYRLFGELVHSGQYLEAESVFSDLTASYRILNLDLNSPEKVSEAYLESTSSDREMPNPKIFPFNMPVLLFLIGTLAIAHRHDLEGARRYLNASIVLADLYKNVFSNLQNYDLEVRFVADWSKELLRKHC
jgi:2-polyprenyl-3-methyl-5-hydroxy-6-metoxy-1,4-benzoquinol methylase